MKEYFEDCQVGDKAVTPARTITESDVVMFAAFTGDWNAIHTDREFAEQSPFGQRIAHGMLSLVVGTALLFRQGEGSVLPKSLIALAGIDRIRFVEPVFLGDTIRLEGETTETTRMQDNKGLVRVQFRIRNQRGADVLTGRFQAMVGCRAASGTEGVDVTA